MKKNSDKSRLLLIGLIAVLVMVSLGVYGATVLRQGQLNIGIPAVVVVIVGLVLLVFVMNNGFADVKKGLPLQDERSKKVLTIAFAKAFIFSIWLLLIIGFLSEDYIRFRDVSQAMSTAILGMTLIFVVCWLWYNRKDDLDSVKI